MVYEELFARLNEAGYKNWLKAGYCLLRVKDALQRYVDNEIRFFHDMLINHNPVLRGDGRCASGCRPRGNQLHSLCRLCEEWKAEILRHHTSGAGMVNWGNCKPWLWPCQHWELAKAYMPRGLANVSGAEHCDAAALLNLLNFCDHFSFIDQQRVREVIRQRNELMHSSEMRVSSQWMEQYQRSLDRLLLQLRHVPEVAIASREITEMLSADWSVCAPRPDAVDGAEEAGLEAGHISQVEAELLRERLEELLLNTQTQDPPNLQALRELQRLGDFLRTQRDLEQRFQSELRSIQLLESQLDCQTTDSWSINHQMKCSTMEELRKDWFNSSTQHSL